MTVSIAKMSIDYYLQNAATGDGRSPDLTAYYTETKAPAGTWFGQGLTGLSGLVTGQTVTEKDARAIYERHEDPVTGQILGQPPMKPQAAPDGARTPSGHAAKSTREAVAGFDLTFSPPKSVSALWALAGPELQGRLHAAHRHAVTEVLAWVEGNVIQSRAGHGGVAQVEVSGIVGSMFDHWDSRAGDPQLHTHAVIANRVQRVSDGKWVTLDSYTLHRHVVAISEMYNSVLFDRLSQSAGTRAESRESPEVDVEALLADAAADDVEATGFSPTHRVELAGVPDALIEEFSTRSAQIEARTDELVAAHVASTGHQPSAKQVLQYRQQATLENRPDKDSIPETTLPQKLASWRHRAYTAGVQPDEVVAAAVGHNVSTVTADMLTDEVRDRLATWSLADTSTRRTTFTRANVRASVERVLRLVRCETFEARTELADLLTDEALAKAVDLTPHRSHAPDMATALTALRGESVFDQHMTSAVYTTGEVLADEDHLLARMEDDHEQLAIPEVDVQLREHRSADGHKLSADQFDAALRVLSSGAGLDAVIGPAGTGKTTTMSAITAAWSTAHGDESVIGLAPSAVVAGVLGDEIGVHTDNVAKWLYESVGDGAAHRAARVARREARLARLEAGHADPSTARTIEALRAQLAGDYAEQAAYTMRPGQLIIVDEASMVATSHLAEVSRQAERAGAKVLLVGDPAQLEAVDAGGFLGHVDRNLDPARLSSVWRFSNPWERAASLRLREGDLGDDASSNVLEVYDDYGRLHGDPETDAADAAYSAWKDDVDAGKDSILIASTNDQVAELNARAHADRVEADEVLIEDTVRLRDGADAGIGEVILARRNDRSLRDSNGTFIANGTRLTITEIHPDGSAAATVTKTGAKIALDADYLASSTELGYATTAHRSQGITVETGHVLASAGLSRELFYVAMTRGKHANHAWVDFALDSHSPDAWHILAEAPRGDTPVQMLSGVLKTSQAEHSAHEVGEHQLGYAHDLGRMCHEADYLMWASRYQRITDWIAEHFTDEEAQRLKDQPAFAQLVTADPARTHAGEPEPGATAADLLAHCTETADQPAGEVPMLPAVDAAGGDQASLWSELTAHFDDQVRAKVAAAHNDMPAWATKLLDTIPDNADHDRVLGAALVWQSVSGHEPDPAAGEPKDQHLKPYWQRYQAILAAAQPETDQPAGEAELTAAELADLDEPDFFAVDEMPPLDFDELPEPVGGVDIEDFPYIDPAVFDPPRTDGPDLS